MIFGWMEIFENYVCIHIEDSNLCFVIFLKFEHTTFNRCHWSMAWASILFFVINSETKSPPPLSQTKGNLLRLQLLTICCDFVNVCFLFRFVSLEDDEWPHNEFTLALIQWGEAKISDPKPICAHWWFYWWLFFGGVFFSFHSYALVRSFIHFFQSNKYSICIDNPLKIDRSLILVHTYGREFFVVSFTHWHLESRQKWQRTFHTTRIKSYLRSIFFLFSSTFQKKKDPVCFSNLLLHFVFIFFNVFIIISIFFPFFSIRQQNTMKTHIIRKKNAIYHY